MDFLCLTIEDFIFAHDCLGKSVLINDGKVVGFVKENNPSANQSM